MYTEIDRKKDRLKNGRIDMRALLYESQMTGLKIFPLSQPRFKECAMVIIKRKLSLTFDRQVIKCSR